MKFSQVPANSGISREYVIIGKVGNTFRHKAILLFYKTDAKGRLSNYITSPTKSAITKNKRMKSAASLITMLLLFATLNGATQSVGINKTNPTEALDVNGNINLNGTIKANGAQGTPGQVLTSTGAGVVWNNMSNEFKNVRQYYTTGTTPTIFNFTVPAGVTRVMVELWGGGGGGGAGSGGSSGNYLAIVRDIAPGTTVSMIITPGLKGFGGRNGFTPSFNRLPENGGTTTVVINGTSFSATGGPLGAVYVGESNFPSYTTPPANFSTYNVRGQSGRNTEIIALYFPTNDATQFDRLVKSGNGGSAYGFEGLGGIGATSYKYTSDIRQLSDVTNASGFGSGGGGGRDDPSAYRGGSGSHGLVVVKW